MWLPHSVQGKGMSNMPQAHDALRALLSVERSHSGLLQEEYCIVLTGLVDM